MKKINSLEFFTFQFFVFLPLVKFVYITFFRLFNLILPLITFLKIFSMIVNYHYFFENMKYIDSLAGVEYFQS